MLTPRYCRLIRWRMSARTSLRVRPETRSGADPGMSALPSGPTSMGTLRETRPQRLSRSTSPGPSR